MDPLSKLVQSFFPGGAAPEDPLRSRSYRRVGIDPGRIYGKFAYRSEATVEGFPRLVEIQATGDHLLLDELVGSEALHVKVGDQGNPWIRLEEGDTLKRTFDRVWITTGAAPTTLIAGLTRPIVEATFLHSWGPIKEKGEKSFAFRRGFKTFAGTATTTEQSIFAPILAIAPLVAMTFGKRGGTIIIRNRDLANTLKIRHGIAGSVGSEGYFELVPGETWTLPVSGRIHSSTDTILVATTAGTCNYSVATSAFDIDRADIEQSIMAGI